MILESLKVDVKDFEIRCGWKLDDRGACRGEVCFPLTPDTRKDGILDVPKFAQQLNMPIVQDKRHGIWSLGPHSGGGALVSAAAPALVLPDLEGNLFDLSSLLGKKVLLIAWASW